MKYKCPCCPELNWFVGLCLKCQEKFGMYRLAKNEQNPDEVKIKGRKVNLTRNADKENIGVFHDDVVSVEESIELDEFMKSL